MLTEMSGIGRWNRRDWLRLSAAGVFLSSAIRTPAQTASVDTIDIVPTPAQAEGLYFVDQRPCRCDIRTDLSNNSTVAGFPLNLAITVSRIAKGVITPLNNAQVDLWQCDAMGLYSDIAAQSTRGLKFLRGYQVTDVHGSARFTTIYPGWEVGRTPHLNIKIRQFAGNVLTHEFNSQLYFEETMTNLVHSLPPYNTRPTRDTTNATDPYFADGGVRLMLRLAKDSTCTMACTHIMISGS